MITRKEVLAALEREPVHDDAGYHCQVCDRAFPLKGTLGVHQVTHRRNVGLAPPYPRGRLPAGPQNMVCGYEGCGERLRRTSFPSHLMGGKHGMSRTEASFYVAQRRKEELAAQSEPPLPVHVSIGPEPEPESVLSDLQGSEAITGILRIARTDGLIPTQLLPDVYELIQHTDAVLHRLVALSRKK